MMIVPGYALADGRDRGEVGKNQEGMWEKDWGTKGYFPGISSGTFLAASPRIISFSSSRLPVVVVDKEAKL